MTAKMYSDDGLHAEEGLARDHEGAQIKAALAARHPGAVDAHDLLDRLDEDVLGQLRHRHAVGGVLEAPRIGVGAEQVHAAVVALVGLQPFENFLGVVQDGAGRIEREVGAHLDARLIPAALGLVVADDRHVIGEDASEAGVDQLGDPVLLGSRIGCGLDIEFHAHVLASRCRWRRCSGARLPVSGAGWLDVVSGRTTASLVTAGFRGQHVRRGHAFAEGGSPVCFAEMPLDNRTVDLRRPSPPVRLTPAALRNATRRETI